MKTNKEYQGRDSGMNQKWEEILSSSNVSFSKSKEEVWKEIDTAISAQSTIKFHRSYYYFRYAAAAILLLLLGTGFFLRFYKKNLSTLAGEHLSFVLPDGSVVDLNAESKLSYHPFWWKFSRLMKLEGEAFFEVEKGRKFEVMSGNGKTSVLGTSFNIFARKDDYRVSCLSGRVKVIASETHETVILNPNERASLSTNGNFKIENIQNTEEETDWKINIFSFHAVGLEEVIEEIARQYGVKIELHTQKDLVYTGNFRKFEDVDITLAFVCKPFGLKFEQKNLKEYVITD